MTTQMSALSDKKNTEQIGDNTLDLKRFNDIFSSNDNAPTSAGGQQLEQKVGDVSGMSSSPEYQENN